MSKVQIDMYDFLTKTVDLTTERVNFDYEKTPVPDPTDPYRTYRGSVYY